MNTNDYHLVRVYFVDSAGRCTCWRIEITMPRDYLDNGAAVARGLACQVVDDCLRRSDIPAYPGGRIYAACIEE